MGTVGKVAGAEEGEGPDILGRSSWKDLLTLGPGREGTTLVKDDRKVWGLNPWRNGDPQLRRRGAGRSSGAEDACEMFGSVKSGTRAAGRADATQQPPNAGGDRGCVLADRSPGGGQRQLPFAALSPDGARWKEDGI